MGCRDPSKHKVHFELKGAFEEEAPWVIPQPTSPFRMRTVSGRLAGFDDRMTCLWLFPAQTDPGSQC
jgi:hypothetical protein